MLWKTKLKAFWWHLLVSIAVIGVFVLVLREVYYPGPLFGLENVWQGLRILLPVDAILGPMLMFYLWDPHKKGVMIDVVTIGVLQIAALIYGGYTIYGQRPAVFSFAGDRFEIIASKNLDRKKLPKEFGSDPQLPLVVYALPAQTPEENREFIFHNVQYQKMPERYRLPAAHMADMAKAALEWRYIEPKTDAGKALWEAFRRTHDEQQVMLFRLEGTTGDAIIVAMDRQGRVVDYLSLDPWEVYQKPAMPATGAVAG